VDDGSDDDRDEYFSGGEDLAATGCSSTSLRGECPSNFLTGQLQAQVRDNRSIGCGCKVNHWRQFSPDAVETLMLNIAAMSSSARKQNIMGELAASPSNLSSERQRVSMSYMILGECVCRAVFLEVHGVSEKRECV